MLKILKELEKLDSIEEKISFLENSLKIVSDDKVEDQLKIILEDLNEELKEKLSNEDSIEFIESKSTLPNVNLNIENLEQITEESKSEVVETLDKINLENEEKQDYLDEPIYSTNHENTNYSSSPNQQNNINDRLLHSDLSSDSSDENLRNSLLYNSDSQKDKSYTESFQSDSNLGIGRKQNEILNLDETEIIKKSQKDKLRKDMELLRRKRWQT